jgi:hypothetical protein
MTRASIVVRTARTAATLVADWHRSSGAAVRRTAVGVFAALFVAMSLSGCAAAATGWDSTSDAKVYLMNNTSTLQFADGSTVDWNTNQGVVLASAPILAVPTDWDPLALPAPTHGALNYVAFLAPKGSERNKTSWKLWGRAYSLDGKGALLPAVWPGYLTNGDSKAIKNAGGTYSMGVAYLKDSDKTVVSAFYTTITIDGGKGTWKFATPPK